MYRPYDSRRVQERRPTDARPRAKSLLDVVMTENGPAVTARIATPPQIKEPQQQLLDAAFFPNLTRLDKISVSEVLLWLREGWLWIVAAVVVCIAAALFYAVVTPPRYTSYTDIIINPSNLNVIDDAIFTSSPQRDTQLLEVESKLRTLTSRNVLARVVADLDLDKDPEFTRPDFFTRLKHPFSSDDPAGDNQLAALRTLIDRVQADREASSFVVTLKVWSGSAEKSVTLSNAIVDAFQKELFQSTSDSSGRVVTDLQGRLEDLRKAVTAAEEKVETFKRDNRLQVNNGELVNNQLSTELNAQVLAAQQRFIQADARYRQMNTAVEQKRTIGASIFDSTAMDDMRKRYVIVQQQIGSMKLIYGAQHPRIVAAEAERASLETAMNEETLRILAAAKAEVDQSRSSLNDLQEKAQDKQSNVFADNDVQVQLRDLERNARSAATIYETYLGRAQQVAEEQKVNSNNVHVISPPVPANTRSWPPSKVFLLAVATVAGTLLGAFMALAIGLWGYVRGTRPGGLYVQD